MPTENVVIPGRVQVAGGRAVHVVEQPGTGPAIVLLGGCGVPYYAWDAVVERLPGRHVVRMDRPGIAGTPWPGRLPTLAEEMVTLADLIDSLAPADGVLEPAILVAHSMGGPHAEGLARRRPDLVAGMVLVDASVERRPGQVSATHPWRLLAAGVDRVSRAVPAVRPLGSLGDRVLTAAQSRRLGLFSARSDLQRAVFREPDAIASVIAEQAAYHDQLLDLAALRNTTARPSVPVRVLTAALGEGEDWFRVQRWLAESLGGTQVVVEDSRHLMMIDRPDVITDAIASLDRAGPGGRPAS